MLREKKMFGIQDHHFFLILFLETLLQGKPLRNNYNM